MERIFKLSSLKGYFKAAKILKTQERKELGTYTLSHTYNMHSHYYRMNFECRVTAQIDSECDIVAFLMEWTSPRSGQQRSETIRISRRSSNLIEGSQVPYFVCPQTGRECRNLYTDGDIIGSREVFSDTYPSNNRSHKEREIAPYRDADRTDPHRKYGKETYRGKLTPYGKRLQRWEEKIEDSEEAWYRYLQNLIGKKIPR